MTSSVYRFRSVNRTKLFLLLCWLKLATSCQSLPSCAEERAYFLPQETNLVIQDQGDPGNWIDFKGYNPQTGKPEACFHRGGFFIYIADRTELGDTLVKKKGQAWYLLKKKKIAIKFEVKCNPQEENTPFKPDTIYQSR
jgi:hypothetical protein